MSHSPKIYICPQCKRVWQESAIPHKPNDYYTTFPKYGLPKKYCGCSYQQRVTQEMEKK